MPKLSKKPIKKTLKSGLENTSVAKKENERIDFLDTGCITLNLAASKKGSRGGWARGRIINLVGDGSSGKTWSVLEALANAFHKFKKTGDLESYVFPKVKKLIMVYNNVEGVMDFDLESVFGGDFVKSIEWISSKTCEEFGRDVQRRIDNLKSGECLLYVADSLDSMTSSAQKERTEKSLKLDKDEDAAYGAEKAKYFSGAFFNNLCEKQQGKDATIFMISQVRENINAGMYAEKYKRTGGKALDFYTHQVCWLKTKEKLKKTFRGSERVFGVRTSAVFKRNKCAKPFREAEFNILFDYGMDNIGSMIDYLFGPKGKGIEWEGEKMSREELISLIEGSKKDKEKLISMVEKDWEEIENAVKPNRKSRWDD
jgi:recombination protein RecA